VPKPRRVPPSVRKALAAGGALPPQIAEVVGHFIAEVGGTRELARVLKVEFDAARAGSIIRQRILDSVLRMLSQANAQVGPVEEMDALAAEDLDREILRVLSGMCADGGEAEEHGAGPADPG
jgi:hypothetical protein